MDTRSEQRDSQRPSRRRAVMWTLVFSYGTNGLVIARTLLLVPLYLQHISFKEYGAWLASGGVLSLLTVIDFGLLGVLAQQCAAAYGAGNKEKLERIVGTGIGVSTILSLLSIALVVAAAPILPCTMGLSGDMAKNVSICFSLAGVANGISLLAFAWSGVLKSLQKTFATGLFLFLAEIVNIILTVGLLLNGWGLYALGWGLLGRGFILLLGNMGWCILVFIGENLSWRLWVWEEAKALWHMSLYTFAGRAASGLMAGSEGFLLGVLISPETAGIYSLTTRAHDIVRSLAGHFSTALMPSLAHLLGEGNRGRFNEVVMTVLKIQMNIAAAGMAGVVVFNESFVSLWVGSGFFAGNWINLLFSIWAIGYMMGGVGWQILYAAGEISYLCKLAWLEASLRIALSFIFIPILGIVGAPLSAIIAQHAGPIYLIAKRILRLLDALRSGLIELTWAMVKRLLIAVFISFLFYQASGLEENWLYFTKYVALYLSCTLAFTLLVDREIFAYLRSARKQ